jgi:hypothetical protein
VSSAARRGNLSQDGWSDTRHRAIRPIWSTGFAALHRSADEYPTSPRHCVRSEAIQCHRPRGGMDCRVAPLLAMTWREPFLQRRRAFASQFVARFSRRVSHFTCNAAFRSYKPAGLTHGFPAMESSRPQRTVVRQRWTLPAFLLYGAIIAGLLGLAVFLPDDAAFEAQMRLGGVVAAKPGRYEAVISNWNRYRSGDTRAEAPVPRP